MSEIFDNDREITSTAAVSGEESEQERLERRAKRRAQMRREKELQAKRRRIATIAVPACLAAILCIAALVKWIPSRNRETEKKTDRETEQQAAEVFTPSAQGLQTETIPPDLQAENTADLADTEGGGSSDNQESGKQTVYAAFFSEATDGINEEEVQSKYVILLDLKSSEVLAEKEARTRINPASMTKILTLLTAADYVDDLDDTFQMTIDITDYSYSHDCSAVGFAKDEVVTVRDLLYGTILPSGGDAAVGLATYVAGSHEAFVELMNDKLMQLGLSGSSHMTNCVGIYSEDHYSTVYDIAMMLEAAINNDLCREVLKAHMYSTSQTPEHPDGITISNWFLRRIEDKDTHGEVVCAKTGFVAQSGCCAASYATDEPGNGFICVTADAHSSWRAIYDHVALYQKYL